MAPVRTLLVDDEPLARRRIGQLLADRPDFAIVGECSNGAEAVVALSDGPAVDLVFLDVQMPDCTGLQVLQQLPEPFEPLVVFVTAYDRYALQAFEAHAVDYLLKPLDPDRFGRCLAHVRQRLGQPAAASGLAALLHALPAPPPPPAYSEQLLVRQPGRLYFVPVEQVHYLEATGNYVTVHTSGATHLLRTTLTQLTGQLDPARFLRIHRSLIVHTPYLKELRPWTHGEYLLTLHDGTHLTSSRSCNAAIQHFLQQFVA